MAAQPELGLRPERNSRCGPRRRSDSVSAREAVAITRAFAAAAVVVLLVCVLPAAGAETDNLTDRFVPLRESVGKLGPIVDSTLDTVMERANERIERGNADPRDASDTEVELAFMQAYRDVVLRKFGDRLLPVFGACIESNDCPGWPRFDRLVLEGTESIYGESRYNRIAISSLAPTIQLCGVRMGTDKLTHLFSNGFFYYNASRRKGVRLASETDAYRRALVDEHGLMGARSTQVISDSDAHATSFGFRLAKEYFEGGDPVFGRNANGLLVRRRPIDLCRFVSPELDESVDPPVYSAGKRKVRRIQEAIAERVEQNRAAEASMGAAAREEMRRRLTARALPADHGRFPLFYKIGIVLRWAWAYFTMPKEARQAIGYLVFPDWKIEDRRPIVLKKISGPEMPHPGELGSASAM